MSGLYPIAGSKIYIGNKVTGKGNVTIADFAGANWTEIGGWANAGAIGDTQETGTQSLINERRVRKFKTVLNAGTMENQFVPMALDPGQVKFKQAIDDCNPYQFKIEWGADCMPESSVVISIASPGVVTWADHGLVAGQPVTFEAGAGGALPAPLTEGTVYYVVQAGLTQNAFSVATTPGGAAVATTGGTFTAPVSAVAPPVGMTDYFYGLALPGARTGGDASSVHLRNWTIDVDSNIVEV